MATDSGTAQKRVYSVWALPPENVAPRLKKLMDSLRSEFGGPKFEPHMTVVGTVVLTEEDAVNKLKAACDGLKAYTAKVDRVDTGTFFYQCVYLLVNPTDEVMNASAHCCDQFGYQRSSPYMPHLSLLYGNLTDEEKKQAEKKANSLDERISELTFPIERLALYETDTEDYTLESWRKVSEFRLSSN